jgi:MFS family permease
MSVLDLERIAQSNVRAFTIFRMFFSARFYYPVYALLFLDYGLTLAQFGLLNGIWAATIVFMVLEMGVLLAAPIGGGALMFGMFVLNRVLSGAAEAAASGADEALVYDSLKAAGQEFRWGQVLERVQRDTSLAFFFAMMIGAAAYDPAMVNAALRFIGSAASVEQSQLVKVPIVLSFFSGVIVLVMALRMKETSARKRRSVRETFAQSWHQTVSASRWIWVTPLPFAIILAAMVLDSSVRLFLTLASQYWNVIDLPIASYGLIGSGMALMGVFVPRLARKMSERNTPLRNFIVTCAAVFIGLYGLGLVIPFWGIVPAIFLYASIQLTGFFVSRYLNEVAPSEQRATVLSFRGLSTNFAYGAVSLMYSALIVRIKSGKDVSAFPTSASLKDSVFIESLGWFPWYFIGSVALFFMFNRLRFWKKL